MSSIRIDFETKEKPFKDMSYSSVDDLEKILYLIDMIEQEKNKFNHEALAVYLDIRELISKYDIVTEYFDIQTGNKPMTNGEDDIIGVIAKRKGLDYSECEKKFRRQLKRVVKDNREKWIDCLMNNEIYTPSSEVEVKRSEEARKAWKEITDQENENIKIDYVRKYVTPVHRYTEVTCPHDLNELIEYQKINEERIKELKKTKNKTFQQKGELTKRIKWNKSIYQDIDLLKFHYGINNESEWAKEKEGVVQVERDMDVDLSYAFDDWDLFEIKRKAKEILTDKQYIIFLLYYEDEFTQHEIAEILGDKQSNITNDIKRIREKLKKN